MPRTKKIIVSKKNDEKKEEVKVTVTEIAINNIKEPTTLEAEMGIVEFMVKEGLADGSIEAKRLLKEGRVRLNGELVTDRNTVLATMTPLALDVERGVGSLL